MATSELISPGEATEAADRLELVGRPDEVSFAGVGPGKLRAECGVGKGVAISALETETNPAGIRTRASTNLFIKNFFKLYRCVLDCFVPAKVHRLRSST